MAGLTLLAFPLAGTAEAGHHHADALGPGRIAGLLFADGDLSAKLIATAGCG
jgi:hypothetical protein